MIGAWFISFCKLKENNWSKYNNNSIVHRIARNCVPFMNMACFNSEAITEFWKMPIIRK